jgi:hypothetical protein
MRRDRRATRSLSVLGGPTLLHEMAQRPLVTGGGDWDMPEDMNLEVAHKLTEREEPVRESRRWEEVIEIVGVLLLAVAAVATAWGGFQAAKGDGRQSILYAEAGVDRVQATTVAIAGEQRAGVRRGHVQRMAAGRARQRCTASGDAGAPVQPGIPDGVRGLAEDGTVHHAVGAAGARLPARVPQSSA